MGIGYETKKMSLITGTAIYENSPDRLELSLECLTRYKTYNSGPLHRILFMNKKRILFVNEQNNVSISKFNDCRLPIKTSNNE